MSWHGKGGEEDVLKDDACILPFHSVFSCSLVKDESEPISPCRSFNTGPVRACVLSVVEIWVTSIPLPA